MVGLTDTVYCRRLSRHQGESEILQRENKYRERTMKEGGREGGDGNKERQKLLSSSHSSMHEEL
jgi:hypothetical protein